jgi:ankyrin repeat protein
VTLFLDVHEFEAQQLLHPCPLELILRVILKQLTDQLPPSLDTMSGIHIENLVHLRQLVRAAAQCFEQTYALIDDVHEISDLTGDALFSELRSLNIQSIAFFGLPLNRMCGDHTTGYCCDNCDEESVLWAECETCKQCYCHACYGEGRTCCSKYVSKISCLYLLTIDSMMRPSMVVEVPLNLGPEAYVKLVLSDSLPDLDSQQLQDAADGILRETWRSLALAKFTLNDFVEKNGGDVLERTRDRLPRSTVRYFNLALLRVKHQRSTADVALGLTTLAIVSLANYNNLSFNAFLGILLRVRHRSGDARLFGERLDRARISRVTKGWISISHVLDATNDPDITLFHDQAWTYLSEEASGFHKKVLGEEGGDLALICLEALTDAAAPSFDDCLSDPDRVLHNTSAQALLRYALHNWGYHFRQHATQAARDAAHKFLLHYQTSRSLRKYYRRTSVSKRSVGGSSMHLLADFGLHELIGHVPPGSADLMVVNAATGLTPAMIACTAGNTEFVSALLLRGATDRTNPLFDLTLRCRMGYTALWYAIQHQQLDVVRLLLSQRGPDVINLQDSQGKTPTMLAIEHHYDIASDENRQRVYNTILQLLLGYKGLKLDVADNFGKTALHIAAMHADHSAVTLLMKRPKGVRIINKRESDAMKRTALMVLLSGNSQMNRRLESVRTLLEYGADAGLLDSRGRTVLHYAAVSDDFSEVMCELVKAKGLSPTRVDLLHSALQVARAYGAETTVALLLPLLSGAASNSSSEMDTASSERRSSDLAHWKESTTAGKRDVPPTRCDPVVSVAHPLNYNQLHSAVRDASLDAVQKLLASPTNEALDVNDTTIDGDTALHLAIRTLEEAAREDDQQQCLALERIIETLLEHVDIGAENAFNEKAIHLAARLIPGDRYKTLIAILEASIRSDVDVRAIRIAQVQWCLQVALTGERRCSARLVEVLLEGGASVFQPLGWDSPLPRVIAQQEGLDRDVLGVLLRWEESL